MLTKLRYGNTNTFFIKGTGGGLLIDTDYAGTLGAFFKAIKAAGIGIGDISYVMATHYHPDHCGLIGELQDLGAKLLLIDVQASGVHFADSVFARDKKLAYKPVRDAEAEVIRCEDGRAFLARLGIGGDILAAPSHSGDSVSVIFDTGDCVVGDLEPLEFAAGYENGAALRADWERIAAYRPKRILPAHANERMYRAIPAAEQRPEK